MKSRKAEIHSHVHAIPALRFDEEKRLTPYAGIILFQALFQKLDLKDSLRRCFSHLGGQPIFGCPVIALLLITHLLLGFRRIRCLDYYREDPLIARVLGLAELPDVSTISRNLSAADAKAVLAFRSLSKDLVLNRLAHEELARVTLDFDGSVLSTKRHAEGTAVGYNKKKKGARSYYPLFCTVAQTAQVLDVHHRSGNVHDSRGSMLFMRCCILAIRRRLPRAQIEVRIDGAFFSERLLRQLDRMGVLFTASVPFDRLADLKAITENRKHWETIDESWSSFEPDWKPKSWSDKFRVVVTRQRIKCQDKSPIQLDLFAPYSGDEAGWQLDHRAIITNHKTSASAVMTFHHGRGCQEQIFAEAKSMAGLDYIPFKRSHANQIYALSAVIAHNLGRELQMQAKEATRGTTQGRVTHWEFETLSTIRQNLVHRAGTLVNPQGRLTLAMNANPVVEQEMRRYLEALQAA